MKNINLFLIKYLNFCKNNKNLSTKTIKAYSIDLQQFNDYILNNGKDLSKEVINKYIAFLQQNYKIKSLKRKIASVKAFCNYLEYEQIIKETPFSKIRLKLHEPILLPKTIPFDYIEKLFSCAYKKYSTAPQNSYLKKFILRDIAVLELLFATGLRVSELCSLHHDSINLLDGTIMVYGKGSKERIIQIGNFQVLSILRDYKQMFKNEIVKTNNFFVNRLNNPLSDQSVRIIISNYVSEANLSMHITPHMFRHSFATFLLEEDVDIRYIQRFLGHSSIVTTQIYTHVASKKQRDILSTKHPRNKMNF